MSFLEKIKNLVARKEELESNFYKANLSSEERVEITKDIAAISEVANRSADYLRLIKEREAIEFSLEKENNEEIISLFKEEIVLLTKEIEELEAIIKQSLIPKDIDDAKNAIMEIRSGTGGEEASLFAYDLLRMYARYAERNGWGFEILSMSSTDIGGIKEVSVCISGKNVFARLKFESGAHRVQRIPKTESGGRIHTSAATVAIMPEAKDIDIEIKDSDLRIDTYRSSSNGGQSVNTTDSAVRITHLPTNTVVIQQDEKSQHKNKDKAMKVLMSRLYDAEKRKRDVERSSLRKSQVGSGDRSERIRTYNFHQGRITDHRVGMTIRRIDEVLKEGDLDEIIDALILKDQIDKASYFSE